MNKHIAWNTMLKKDKTWHIYITSRLHIQADHFNMQTVEHDVFWHDPHLPKRQNVIKCKTKSEPTIGWDNHAPNYCMPIIPRASFTIVACNEICMCIVTSAKAKGFWPFIIQSVLFQQQTCIVFGLKFVETIFEDLLSHLAFNKMKKWCTKQNMMIITHYEWITFDINA